MVALNHIAMAEKITLTLDRSTLEALANRAQKTMSEFVRDLIQREKELTEDSITISKEIKELRGCLPKRTKPTKERVREAAVKKLRNYKRA